MLKVLISGCGLTVNEYFRSWGDLWEVGDCYVFNACGPEEGLEGPFEEHTTQLILTAPLAHDSYFQRRNVFVVPKAFASLNKAAQEYLARSPQW